MAKIKRVLGKRGRTTIPFAITDDKTCVVITKEKICTDCITALPNDKEISLDAFLSRMSKEEKLKALSALSKALVSEEETA